MAPERSLYFAYPTLVAVITAKSQERVNAMSAAWHTPLSFEPFLYGVAIAPSRFTHGLIEASGEFAVNFLSFQDAHYITLLGRTSGAQVDKVRTFRLELQEPQVIQTPLLRRAYAAYECRVVQQITTGDHTLFVGEVVAAHARPGAFSPEGPPQLPVADPALYLGRDLYVSLRSLQPVSVTLQEAQRRWARERSSNPQAGEGKGPQPGGPKGRGNPGSTLGDR